MLVLRKDQEPVVIDLGGGASISVRPANTMDVEQAGAEVSVLIVGLMSGADAATQFSLWLGDELRTGDLTDNAWKSAIIKRATLFKLASKCCVAWAGIGDDDGNLLELDEPNLSLLLRDPTIARKISNVIEAPVHIRSAEKNGSAASLNGVAAAVDPTAPNASVPVSAAPADIPG